MTTIRLDSPAQDFPYAESHAVDVPVSTIAGDSLVIPTKAIVQKLPGVSRLICLDVGGVLANKDTDDDYSHLEPLEGCREFLEQLRDHDVGTVVNSAHPIEEVTEWLKRYDLYSLISGGTPDPALYQGVEQYGPVVAAKPRAEKYLDDRMVRYKGDYEEALDAILDFRPWWADKGYEVDSVALDFDATLNTYGMRNTDDEINHPSNLFEPQDGAREFVAKLYSKVGRVVIFSCRNPAEIQEWLKKYRFERHIDAIEDHKPKVKVYLDDRGMRFKGDYAKTLEKLRLLEPEEVKTMKSAGQMVYERGDYYAIKNSKGHYEIYRNHGTSATKVGYIGFTGEEGLRRVIAEIERRMSKSVAGGVLGINSPPGNSTATPRVHGEPQTKDGPPHSAPPPDPQWTEVGPEQEPRPTYPPPEDFGTSTEPRPAMYANGWATPSVETVDKTGEVQPTAREMMGDRFGNAPWNNQSYGADHNTDLPPNDVTNAPGVNAPDLSHDARGPDYADVPLQLVEQGRGDVDVPQKKAATRDVADAAIEAIRHIEDSNRGRSAQKLRELIWPVFQHWEQQIDASEGSESDKKRAHSRLGTFIRPHASFRGGVRKVGSGPEGPGPAVLRLSDSPTIVADIKQAYREGYAAGSQGARPEDNPYIVGEPYKNSGWSAGWQDGSTGSAPQTKDYFPGIAPRGDLEGDHPTYSMWGDGGWKQLAGNPNDEYPTGVPIDYNLGDSGPMVSPKRKSLETVDYIELPEGVDGTRCQNCLHYTAECSDQPAATSADFNGTGCAVGFDQGHCDYPEVNGRVSARGCCNAWDHEGVKRPWKGKTVRLDKTGSVEQRDDGWWYRMPPNRESGPYHDRATALGALGMEQINYHRSKTAPFSVERRDDGWWVVGPVGTWNEHGPFDEWGQADRAADRLMNKAAMSVNQFAAKVNALADHAPASARWGKGEAGGSVKVFIGYLKYELGLPDKEFNDLLFAAHRQGLVKLARADLVEAMHPADVRSSEVQHPSGMGEFHFVTRGGGGAIFPDDPSGLPATIGTEPEIPT